MISTCLLHNSKTCGKKRTIERSKLSDKVRLVFGYDWNTKSDNIALIQEEVLRIFNEFNKIVPFKFSFQNLGAKDGSIYCDICRQLHQADIALFDISTSNLNVIFELGLAIGTGTYVFVLRSRHYKKSTKSLSDLNGILEYRFSRRRGRLSFQADFEQSLKKKLSIVIKNRMNNFKSDLAI